TAEVAFPLCQLVGPLAETPPIRPRRERILRPYQAEEMVAYPVRRWVNDPKHEGPGCVERVSDEGGEGAGEWSGRTAGRGGGARGSHPPCPMARWGKPYAV